ncbi:hypothetical protein YSA_09006 [Pseudomonas putida ND6]|uniref:Uncharacterized protein n=1 Tax=Pseudomonas putida ND6 TaxID=231023 RepID=I3V1L6_PSEPU|nr:hypothetical protein YSA_09006 [Pseudomonas putida ND6]
MIEKPKPDGFGFFCPAFGAVIQQQHPHLFGTWDDCSNPGGPLDYPIVLAIENKEDA